MEKTKGEKMNTIDKKYIEALELPKVLKMLSEECTGEKAKKAAMQLEKAALVKHRQIMPVILD